MLTKTTYIREEREITEQMKKSQWEKAWITRWHNLIDALKEENAEQQETIKKLRRTVRELKKEIKGLTE